MNNKLRIEEIRDVFGSKPFTSDDLYRFYQKYDPYLNMNTFRWRIYTLKKNEAIRTLKRGVYSAKNKSDFKSSVNKEIIDMVFCFFICFKNNLQLNIGRSLRTLL